MDGLEIRFIDSKETGNNSRIACQTFLAQGDPGSFFRQISIRVGDEGYYLLVPGKLNVIEVYGGIRAACTVGIAKQEGLNAAEAARMRQAEAEQATVRQESAERNRQTAVAKREADFRNGILTALHAAEEADPFSSIRGDFDLSGSDSRQWKTSLRLPDAEKCALLKTAAQTAKEASAWTFACMFGPSGDGYEPMVKSVQSALNLPFQPDEKAVNMNQVYFADPAKPAWRFFAARMNDGTVGVSVVAVRFADTPATAANTTPFPSIPTMLPRDHPTVGAEVVRSGQASPTQASDVQCEAYRRQESERASRDQEIRRLQAELQDSQMRYQAALRKALESEQQANSNTVTAQKGPLGTLQAATSTLATLTAQKLRADAQSLQEQVNLKQSQLTNAQTSALAFTVTAPPASCGHSSPQ